MVSGQWMKASSIYHLPFTIYLVLSAENEIRLVAVLQFEGAQAVCHAHVAFQIFFNFFQFFSRKMIAETCACDLRVSFRNWRRFLGRRTGLRAWRRSGFRRVR